MKAEEFKKLWNAIEGKEIKIRYGYQSPTIIKVKFVSFTEYKRKEIYVICDIGGCYYVKAIREVIQ